MENGVGDWLKTYYKRKIDSHEDLAKFYDHSAEPMQDEIMRLIDQLYTGDNHESALLSFLEQIPEIKTMMRGCYYNLPRTIASTNMFCQQIQVTAENDPDKLQDLAMAMFGEYDPNNPMYDKFADQADFNSQMQDAMSDIFDQNFANDVKDFNDLNDTMDKLFGKEQAEQAFDSERDPAFVNWLSKSLDNKTLKNILAMFGKFQTFISKKKKELAENGMDDIKDVIFGNDLSMVLEDEFVNLADEHLEHLFYLDYVNEELLEFVTESKKPKNKGPLHLFLDISGSMSAQVGQQGVTRHEMSSGLLLAIAKQMEEEDRSYTVDTYNARVANSWTSTEMGIEKLFQMLVRTRPGGGTSASNVLQTRIPQMNSETDDIIVITDADEFFDDNAQKVINGHKDELNLKLSTLLIGRTEAGPCFQAISDSFICVDGSSVDKGMTKLIEKEILPQVS